MTARLKAADSLSEFTPELRARTESLAARMHLLFGRRSTPAPIFTKACKSCSLVEDCYPRPLSHPGRVVKYLKRAFDPQP